MPEEDGVVQRHSQLQHSGNSFGDVGNLPQEIVAAHVPQNADANAQQENQRQQEGVHGQHQHHAAQHHGDGHIDAFLFLHHLLGVRYHGRQAADEALLIRNAADLLNGFHGAFRRGSIIEEHSHQPAVILLENLPNVVRQDFHRDGTLHNGSISNNGVHMVNASDGLFQVSLFHLGQPLGDTQAERSLVEVLHQDILTTYRIQIFRQIVQQVILHLCRCHAEDRRHQQCQAQNDDQCLVMHQPSGKLLHAASSFSELPYTY